MVNEIKVLYDSGKRDEAFELLDKYLGEHGNDVEALVLKVTLCLELKRELAQVAPLLDRLQGVLSKSKWQVLKVRTENRLRALLEDGRSKLNNRSWRDAAALFKAAVDLSGNDPAILFAAGYALCVDEDESAASDWDDSPLEVLLFHKRDVASRMLPSDVRVTGEEFLRQAVIRAPLHSGLRRQALTTLADLWLASGQVAELLDLLDLLADNDGVPVDVLGQEVGAQALGALMYLLRLNRRELAGEVLEGLQACLPESATLHLLRAEWLLMGDAFEEALTAYRAALQVAGQAATAVSLEVARAAWAFVQAHPARCERCEKPLDTGATACAYCGAKVTPVELFLDTLRDQHLPEAAIAHLGIAATLARLQRPDEVPGALEAARTLLPEDHPALTDLDELRGDLVAAAPPEAAPAADVLEEVLEPVVPPNPVLPILEAWRADGFSRDILGAVARTVSEAPTAWLAVPFATRRTFLRALLKGGYLALARDLLPVASADNPQRRTVIALTEQIAAGITREVSRLLEQAQATMARQGWAEALDLAQQALALAPQWAAARLVRAAAAFGGGQFLAALADYYTVLDGPATAAEQRQARLGVAAVFEARLDLPSALEALDGLQGEDVARIRERLRRLLNHEPVVRLERATEALMQDTLTWTEVPEYTHAYFAVALRAVGRPWGADPQSWQTRILQAGFEFVQVLGGLHNAVGTPIFSLRLISRPDPALSGRGTLTIAILARVSGPDAATARQLALGLWQVMRTSLPLEEAHVYDFVPVADEAELESLLMPFPVHSVAQIVRREQVINEAGGRYVVYPFVSGTLDMHNLCSALLRQREPVLLSIHLQPTELLPWERTSLEEMMLGQRVVSLARFRGDGDDGGPWDPVARWWEETGQAGTTQANRLLLDSLSPQAYVLQVNVAAGSHTNDLLPEQVAATLFGPAQSGGGTRYGGYEIIRTVNEHDLAAARRNLETLDVGAWVYSAAPSGAPRLRHMVGEYEAALAFRLPVPDRDGVPGLPVIKARPVPPPVGMPLRGMTLGRSMARLNGLPVPITQGVDDRRRHTYLVGMTGTGKSTLIKNQALQDIEAGRGVCVIDPHGDLVEDILLRIPLHRVKDVILVDPSDVERPIGLNLLNARTEAEQQRIVNEFIGLLIRLYDHTDSNLIVGPRFQHNVRNAMLTAMSMPGSTLIEVVRVLTDRNYMRQVLPNVTDPVVRSYWEHQMAQTTDFHWSEILDYLVSKFSRFVGDSQVRNIVGQRETTVNFREVMDRQQILLVNLSKGKIGEQSAHFIGLVLVQCLLMAALSRSDMPVEQRPDFFLYVDEFQNFATDLFGVMLSEGRKYGIAITMANQYLTQLDPAIREAVFGNVGTLVSFRLGVQDAAALIPALYPVFGGDDLINLPNHTACVKLQLDGTAARPFTMETLPDTRPPDPRRAAAVREFSRQTYGRDAATVSKDVLARYLG